MSSSERINMWQSGKLQQRLEKGTMCTKRWCKRKFVPSGFLPCWLRSTTFSKKVSSQLKKDMLLKVMTFFTVLTCKESWFHHFGNKTTEQGMASHDTAPPPPKKKPKTRPSVHKTMRTVFLGWWKHTGQVFATLGNHQCWLLPSDTSEASSCIVWQTSREEKDHPATQKHMAPHCLSLHAEATEKGLWTSLPSTQQSRPNRSNYHGFRFTKDKMQGQHCVTNEAVHKAIHHCLWTAETVFHC